MRAHQAAKPLPIVPLMPWTVDINGTPWSSRSTIWAGLRWHEAEMVTQECLSVPFCHIDDDMPSHDCGWYRIRPRDSRYQFVQAKNGAFVLKLREANPCP